LSPSTVSPTHISTHRQKEFIASPRPFYIIVDKPSLWLA
jgi:hypothetical protein